MATTKLTVTLEDNQLQAIRDHVAAGRASSVSGFVQHAVGVALFDAEGWSAILQESLQQSGGPLTSAERAWADDILAVEDAGHTRPDHRKLSTRAAASKAA